MIQIDINEIFRLDERRREINRIPMEEIQWMDGDFPIHVTKETIKEWEFCGMGSFNFPLFSVMSADGTFGPNWINTTNQHDQPTSMADHPIQK